MKNEKPFGNTLYGYYLGLWRDTRTISQNRNTGRNTDEHRFYCTTILTIPVFCGIYARTEITIRIRDIVIEVVRRIVEVERIVEVPIETIVNEVFIVHRDKEVDFESIILEVERRVRASIPHISLARVDVPVLIAEVSKAVLDGTPYTETGQVEHRVSKPKRRIPTPVTPPLQDNPTPVTPPPVENKDGGYIVYSHRVNGGIQSGVIHSDYAAIEDGKISTLDRTARLMPETHHRTTSRLKRG